MEKKFKNPRTGEIVTAKTKEDAKRMTACGWQKVKPVKQVFANGSKNGQRFI